MRAAPEREPAGPRINEDIRVREVRLIDENGDNIGVVPIADALARAVAAGLDLVEISPDARPPVTKVLDYGKFKYQEQKKAAEARKRQKIVEIKEIKMRPSIDDHDYDVKMRSMKRFFDDGDKVKVTLRFRGRELSHQELGWQVLQRVKAETQPVAKGEARTRMEGRRVVMGGGPRVGGVGERGRPSGRRLPRIVPGRAGAPSPARWWGAGPRKVVARARRSPYESSRKSPGGACRGDFSCFKPMAPPAVV